MDTKLLDERLRALAISEQLTQEVQDYAHAEFERGVEYHIDYVGRLGMTGQRVLDAGCGVGNWSLALSRYYTNVTALEFNPDRLHCTRLAAQAAEVDIETIEGSIEDLPFEDGTFDGVFCNGVIFLTDWRRSLSELQRVLKPGGTLYVSFDDLAWWDFLIHDRGPKEPHLLPMASGMLVNQVADYLHRLPATSQDDRFAQLCVAAAAILGAVGIDPLPLGRPQSQRRRIRALPHTLWAFRKPLGKLVVAALRLLRESFSLNTVDPQAVRFLPGIAAAVCRVYRFGTRAQKATIVKDLARFLDGKPVLDEVRRGYCIGRAQMVEAIKGHGLEVVGAASEGLLTVDARKALRTPIYASHQGVVEVVARKPDSQQTKPSAAYFRRNGHRAAWRFTELVTAPVLSSQNQDAFAMALSQHYVGAAQKLASDEFVGQLVADIVSGVPAGEPQFQAIYTFLQDAIFHHPLVQLIDQNASALLDSRSILLSGIGRCGHVAKVACDLYRAAGYEARVTQLYKHLCAEVLVEGRWLVVDADAFKGGCWPRNSLGAWATLHELRAAPMLVDQVPAIGLQLAPTAPWSQGVMGARISGYTDVGCAWERPFTSYLYFGENTEYPPAPPEVTAVRRPEGGLRLTATRIAGGTRCIRIALGTHSRGWSYEDVPDAAYLGKPAQDVALLELSPEQAAEGVTVSAPTALIFMNVFGLNEYQRDNESIWVWPAPEIVIPAAEEPVGESHGPEHFDPPHHPQV